MVYLYGGNTAISRKRHGQYLIHLAALYLATQEDTQFYDLGGYDSDKGYGQFKEGYKGALRSFLGPVDLVCRPLVYNSLQGLIGLVKGSRSGAKQMASKQLRMLDLAFKFVIGLLITSSLPLWWFTIAAYSPGADSQPETFEVALVFGASVDFIELTPSRVLQERLDTAADLYQAGKISTVLVSGDNREPDYNEPFVMKKYLVEQRGLPPVSIVEDFGGRRTLDSCWRAKNVFQAERVYLVTQRFHLPRAEFSCRQVGLDTILAPAEDSTWQTTYWGVIREIPASWLAIEDVLSDYEPPVVSDGTEVNVEEEV
jgi:SanA protein